jgi:hypothetical protein
MYNHLDFCEVRENKSIDYDELLDLAQDRYAYDSSFANLSDMGITNEGVLQWNGHEQRMTQPAFVKLCRQLRIPDPFAKHIPWDLLKHNIDTLSRESQKGVQIFTRDIDGTLEIVNVASDTFVPVSHDIFINSIREHSPEIKRGVISDINMEIDITNPAFEEDPAFAPIEVKKGDIVETGLNFNNSTAGHNFTSAKLFLWRLVCTNGLTMPVKTGYAKLRAKPGRDIMISVNNFLTQVRSLSLDSAALGHQLKSLDRSFNPLEFTRYFKGLDKVLKDKEFLDEEIFEVSAEDRGLYLSQERAFKKGNLEELPNTPVNGYRMVNNLTNKAKEFEQMTRQKMEAYGGKILSEQEIAES